MTTKIAAAWLLPLLLLAQSAAPPAGAKVEMTEAEQQELSRALQDVGNSSVDFIRVLEAHLKKYPNTPKRLEFERALTKAAIDAKDDARIMEYGQKVLETDRPGDPLTLERVARVLVERNDPQSNTRALDYARRLEQVVRQAMAVPPSSPDGRERATFLDEAEKLIARAQTYQARATGNLGKVEEAVKLAQASYATVPTADAARERGRWLARQNRFLDAVDAYAEAFTISDPRSSDADRLADRRKMAELYSRVKDTQDGLGDRVLRAFDATAAAVAERRTRLRQLDPNGQSSDPLDYSIASVSGNSKLDLKTLRGKVVVMDFWATWCGPCRVQHPMYEEVKKRFALNPEVVFLSINTDEDRERVLPFLDAQKWDKSRAYFEDGLASLLRVTSIPTTVIFGKKGQIASRMNGFVEGRFVDLLTERIRQTLAE